jgi:hypothetical protein
MKCYVCNKEIKDTDGAVKITLGDMQKNKFHSYKEYFYAHDVCLQRAVNALDKVKK